MHRETILKRKCLIQKQERNKDLWHNTGGPGGVRDHTELAVTDPDWIRQTYKL